ncbi:MAG: family 43 glycosylhydrolase [Clostridia bacterium]|nr:family 43 glycosylhydrolase [Clostridia bacterium]
MDKKYIALTFDDGHSNVTERVLDILEENQIPGTFFIIGEHITEASREIFKRQLKDGCEICNHSWSHNHMSNLSANEIKKEIEDTSNKIKEYAGVEPTFFRPPFLDVSNDLFDNVDLPFVFGFDSRDWDSEVTTEQRINNVLHFARDGAIILMHDFDDNYRTLEALPVIIRELKARGFEFVCLSKLFEVEKVNPHQYKKLWSWVKDPINPLTKTDYPDPDVIRVDDTYYMISTTMYYMPGGVILKSHNLKDWEIASYIFDELDGTPSERLDDDSSNYGEGMWAASLRYHDGKFYAAFVSHGQENTHLFVADNISGPWEHRHIKGYFHDCSLLFDDDGRNYIVSGNTDIRITELNEDLSAPKENGLDKIIISDNRDEVRLGYEGAHFYKINGKYYITLIHLPKDGIRTEAVFVSDKIEGPYEGKDVMCDAYELIEQGIAQGGLVDTPDGKYFSIMFQDSGAVGRVPFLVPVNFKSESDIPEFGIDGKLPFDFDVPDLKPSYKYEPLFVSDDFSSSNLKKPWQWNHVPDNSLWEIKENSLRITTDRTVINPLWAKNTLTQRMNISGCSAAVTVDASLINDGDYAGLIALQGCYNFIGITKENGKFYLVKMVKTEPVKPFEIGYTDRTSGDIVYKEEINSSALDLKLSCNFFNMADMVDSYYRESDEGTFSKIGSSHNLKFALDHFTGARFGLCMFSTKTFGGTGIFKNFIYKT